MQEGELGALADGPAGGGAVAVEGGVARVVEGVGVGEGLRVRAVGRDVGGVDWGFGGSVDAAKGGDG